MKELEVPQMIFNSTDNDLDNEIKKYLISQLDETALEEGRTVFGFIEAGVYINHGFNKIPQVEGALQYFRTRGYTVQSAVDCPNVRTVIYIRKDIK